MAPEDDPQSVLVVVSVVLGVPMTIVHVVDVVVVRHGLVTAHLAVDVVAVTRVLGVCGTGHVALLSSPRALQLLGRRKHPRRVEDNAPATEQ